ncbi:hypothetical protein AAT19DRAFT_11693 [Rhodotorula toruloides]|uniref:Uncharacterized protein n=1 Tax=Rhodotorula toruloides TaxID=5286 RepID=A0A2S9ZW97_RHOTO|nr:hypothetical protein AAT19DRAFT_11693 [Rhodotorula toruloides]
MRRDDAKSADEVLSAPRTRGVKGDTLLQLVASLGRSRGRRFDLARLARTGRRSCLLRLHRHLNRTRRLCIPFRHLRRDPPPLPTPMLVALVLPGISRLEVHEEPEHVGFVGVVFGVLEGSVVGEVLARVVVRRGDFDGLLLVAGEEADLDETVGAGTSRRGSGGRTRALQLLRLLLVVTVAELLVVQLERVLVLLDAVRVPDLLAVPVFSQHWLEVLRLREVFVAKDVAVADLLALDTPLLDVCVLVRSRFGGFGGGEAEREQREHSESA